jgi:hypothetical protein
MHEDGSSGREFLDSSEDAIDGDGDLRGSDPEREVVRPDE